MTEPIYAIGDIHGHLALLEMALERIASDGGLDAKIVFLGDYVDRGPDSAGVITLLDEGLKAGRNWICLKGNHDRMFEWFLEDVPRHDPHLLVGYHWLHERLGGTETLQSYGVTVTERTRLNALHDAVKPRVPDAHRHFLRNLDLTYETEALFFTHAGIRPDIALKDQEENDLVWIRQGFLEVTRPHPKLIIHGHTAIKRATHYGNRVNLDSSAAYGGPLTAAVFEGDQVWVLGENGRDALTPL